MITAISFKKFRESRFVGVVAATSLLVFVILPALMLAGVCSMLYIAIQTVRHASTSSVSRR